VTEDDRRAATAKLWGLADYSGVARRLEPAAALVDTTAPGPGDRVLDVAAGGPVRFDAEYLLAQAR
jgi:hypothetical protein